MYMCVVGKPPINQMFGSFSSLFSSFEPERFMCCAFTTYLLLNNKQSAFIFDPWLTNVPLDVGRMFKLFYKRTCQNIGVIYIQIYIYTQKYSVSRGVRQYFID